MVHVEDISAREAVHVGIANDISQDMMSTLKNIGVTKLYSHQVWMLHAWLFAKIHIFLDVFLHHLWSHGSYRQNQ